MEAPVKYLQVDISDVARLIYSGPCTKLVAPAAFGEICILPRHAPLLTRLQPGEVRLQTDRGEDQFFFLSGGYLEVSNSTVTVLADQMLRSEEIDRDAALEAKRNAERILRESHLFSERDKANLELAEALVKLRVLEHVGLDRLRKTGS
jgi:F-type H+-transporting ATPase subunit epsilon